MTDGRGKLTRYSYAAFGKLKSVTNADSKAEAYKYDLSGNTACVIDKNGNSTVYTYDNLGLLIERKVVETGDSIKYSYDEVGNRISMQDESGTSTYTYDENNRLLAIQKGGITQLSYAYDQIGNVAGVTDLKGNTVTYTYDKASRMETVSNTGKTTTYSYDENGRRKSITYNGGVSEQYTYNKDNQLTNLANKKLNGAIISEYQYTYDLAGRQLSKTDSYGTTNYEYDKAGRITKVTTPGKTTVYAYDKAGNRISLNETYTSPQPSEYVDEATGKDIQYILKKSEYTYSNSNTLIKLVERMFDENNKELARKTTKYVYDANGNQLKQSISHTLPDNTQVCPSTTGTAYGDNVSNDIDKLLEKTSYTYDGFNRLKKTETIKGGIRTTAEYTYNGDDLRVSKTVKKSNNNYISEVTNYLYDRQNVILETDANNNIKARYIKGINYIAKSDAQNNTSYFLFNGHGDVVQTVDESGTVQNQYDYDIWGNPTLTVETSENAIRYSGEFLDNETGLYYLRARYYDPYTGRFTSEDSYWGEEENPLSLNLYTYCENDPIQYVDPSGHETTTITSMGILYDVDSSELDWWESVGWQVFDGEVKGEIDNYSNVDVINTAAGSNTTITNHESYHIGTINTGAGSTTTINNRGIIDTINTGEGSSLVMDNTGNTTNINIGENGSAIIHNYDNINITVEKKAFAAPRSSDRTITIESKKVPTILVNGTEIKPQLVSGYVSYRDVALALGNGVLIDYMKLPKGYAPISEVAKYFGVGDCFSWWTDTDGYHAVIQTDMRNQAVQVIRRGNTINITAYVNINGNAEYTTINGVSYHDLAIQGFKEWGTTINESVKINGKKLTVNVEIVEVDNYSKHKSVLVDITKNQNPESEVKYGDSNIWSITNTGSMTLNINETNYMAKKGNMGKGFSFKMTAAHEFGHVLGIDDAYESYYATDDQFSTRPDALTEDGITEKDMMRGGEVIKKGMTPTISVKDYEMLWYAWATNNLQSFGDYSEGIKKNGCLTIFEYKKSHVLNKGYHTCK